MSILSPARWAVGFWALRRGSRRVSPWALIWALAAIAVAVGVFVAHLP